MFNPHIDDLMKGKVLVNASLLDSLSIQRAKFDPLEMIQRELIKGIVDYYVENNDLSGVITRTEDLGKNIEYKAELSILTRYELYELLDKAFHRGMDFQYNAMHRVLGEQIAKSEESKTNGGKETDSE